MLLLRAIPIHPLLLHSKLQEPCVLLLLLLLRRWELYLLLLLQLLLL